MNRSILQTSLAVVSFLLIGFYISFAQEHSSKLFLRVDTKSQDAKFKIETVVSLLKGVSEAEFDLQSKKLTITYDPNQIQEDMVQFTIQSLGYPVTKWEDKTSKLNKAKDKEIQKDSTSK